MNRLLKILREEKREFVSHEELKTYCKDLYFNYKIMSNYLVSRGYLLKIFDNIYYVKTDDELKQKKVKYSILELVGKGIEHWHNSSWYYGLYTALYLNNIKYEHKDKFYYLISDRIISSRPRNILGKKFRFIQFKSVFLSFGIINKSIRYSNPEKTILDLIYMWDYSKITEDKIVIELSKLLNGISEEKILEYSQHYPISNKNLLRKGLKKL